MDLSNFDPIDKADRAFAAEMDTVATIVEFYHDLDEHTGRRMISQLFRLFHGYLASEEEEDNLAHDVWTYVDTIASDEYTTDSANPDLSWYEYISQSREV